MLRQYVDEVLRAAVGENWFMGRGDPAPCFGDYLSRGYGTEERARQQQVWTPADSDQTARRRFEASLPVFGERTILVRHLRRVPSDGNRVAYDQKLHDVLLGGLL